MMTWSIKFSLYLSSFLIVIRTDQDAVDFCKDNICGDSIEHTLCKFSGPSPNCIDYEEIITSPRDKQLVLDKINSRRNKVASGEIRSLPGAERMIKLEWNDELSLSAQRWADQCESRNVEDTCRDLVNISVGQNVATIKGESPGLSPHVLVDLWYIELLNMNTSLLSSYQPSSGTGLQHYDYFTRLVWDTITAVGCGGVKFLESEKKLRGEKKTVYRLVCNFSPSGNYPGIEVYAAGEPCSKCPENYSCDSGYPSLCSRDIDEPEDHTVSSKANMLRTRYFLPTIDEVKNNSETNHTKIKSSNNVTLLDRADNDFADSFDLFSHLFETSTASTEITQITSKCKDVVAVEELIRILKNKFNTEQLVRDFLYSTKTSSLDSSPSDDYVEAVVQQIYSKKIPITTLSVTESDHMNSTLLANLVEAIIFRKSDAITTTHNPYADTPTYNNIKPIKIQASLGEVNVNSEFSGHLFFPEEDETEENSEKEATESYYDSIDMPASDIAFENFSKNARTRNFLDEVLEDELFKDGVTEENPTSTHRENRTMKNKRSKRNYKNHTNNYNVIEKRNSVKYVHYFDLLRKIAADLRQLKLREIHYCALSRSDFKLDNNLFLFTLACSIIVYASSHTFY